MKKSCLPKKAKKPAPPPPPKKKKKKKPGSDSGVCLLSGIRMAYEDVLFLIGHFWSHATIELAIKGFDLSRAVTLGC